VTRKRLFFVLQCAVTGILLAFLFRGFDWQAFRKLLHGIPWSFYAFSLATVFVGQGIYAWRWHVLLAALGVPVSFVASFRQYMVGVFFNNFLPSTMGGDSTKVYYLGRSAGYLRVTASVLVDRVLGIFLVTTLAVLCLNTADQKATALLAARAVLTLVWFALATALVVIAWAPRHLWIGGLVRRWPALKPAADRAVRLAAYIKTALRHPLVVVASSLVVFVYFLLLGLVYQQFIALATGARCALLPVIGVVAAIAALSNVPVSVNGLGLREQLHLALFATFGLAPEAAAGISLLLFAHLMLASVVGAVFWMRMKAAGGGALRA
jgi:hypothetical protein